MQRRRYSEVSKVQYRKTTIPQHSLNTRPDHRYQVIPWTDTVSLSLSLIGCSVYQYKAVSVDKAVVVW